MAKDPPDDLAYRPTREHQLIDDTRPEIKSKSLDTIRFKSREELKWFNKMPNVETARTMLRRAVSSNVTERK